MNLKGSRDTRYNASDLVMRLPRDLEKEFPDMLIYASSLEVDREPLRPHLTHPTAIHFALVTFTICHSLLESANEDPS
jgi:hypothetical protein